MLKKNEKLTLLDNPQILRHTFDEEHDAQRVIIVNDNQKSIVQTKVKIIETYKFSKVIIWLLGIQILISLITLIHK